MSETEGIIHAAGDAARMARMYGCKVDILINRGFGRSVQVTITPDRVANLDEEELMERSGARVEDAPTEPQPVIEEPGRSRGRTSPRPTTEERTRPRPTTEEVTP